MNRLFSTVLCVAFLFCLTTCGNTSNDKESAKVNSMEHREWIF